MEKYKLKKDTFFYKAGTTCKLTQKGNMVLDNCEGTCILHNYHLKDHPELLDEWFEKIEEKKYGMRVLKKGDAYLVISSSGAIVEEIWNDDIFDYGAFGSNSAFLTREEAEKELKHRRAYVILKDDVKGFEPNFADKDQLKYFVVYDFYSNKLDFDIAYCYKADESRLYFETVEDVRASIDNHKQEWFDYLDIKEEE